VGGRGHDMVVRRIPERSKKEHMINDKQIYIRLATDHDGEKLRGMFSRSSPETIYRRFHIPYPEVPAWILAMMLDADHHDEESLVAIAEEKIVGHAMYARECVDGEAEMAILVEDEWQSMGIGKALLSELAERAKRRGIETFTAEVLGMNRPMLGLAGTFAGARHTIEDSVHHVRMPLRATEPAVATPQVIRRAA
jgi:GNAT superfamily N-acetyltransferase